MVQCFKVKGCVGDEVGDVAAAMTKPIPKLLSPLATLLLAIRDSTDFCVEMGI